ncbi:hypothetical protein C8P63_110115 [Melghirimyces profundicolus]|uniref:Uncharacterized protein n=1 Tax=Melghirimyces profundicolus TaxID=1242148 RepID=A0A2T6BV74_9BACL|nr:hypothetical protein [Melghirimyces profundicolus]PTX59970.1 hypothetical protein C8P63_110115 [Melghirimyces profundicolus]
MKDQWKFVLRTGLIYLSVIAVTLVANGYYREYQTQVYIDRFKEEKGMRILNEISETYKITMEHYSNYKLNREMKQRLVDKLNKLNNDLRKVEESVNSGEVSHQIDFSFLYHDIKLVNIALSDTSKDDVVPVIVLHAMEGLGELKKEITYIQYR